MVSTTTTFSFSEGVALNVILLTAGVRPVDVMRLGIGVDAGSAGGFDCLSWGVFAFRSSAARFFDALVTTIEGACPSGRVEMFADIPGLGVVLGLESLSSSSIIGWVFEGLGCSSFLTLSSALVVLSLCSCRRAGSEISRRGGKTSPSLLLVLLVFTAVSSAGFVNATVVAGGSEFVFESSSVAVGITSFGRSGLAADSPAGLVGGASGV